jgi:hypothetical protein
MGTSKSWIWHLEPTLQNKYIQKTNRTTKHTPSRNISHIPYTTHSQPRIPQEPAHIFTNSLNSLYLINTQIKHPIQQNNHPDKTILALIVNLLKNRAAPTTLYKVRAHTNIIGNEEVDKLAKEGSKIDPKK